MEDGNTPSDPVKHYTGVGAALGLAFGAAFGAAFDDVGIGVALGVALGVAIGAGIGTSLPAARHSLHAQSLAIGLSWNRLREVSHSQGGPWTRESWRSAGQ